MIQERKAIDDLIARGAMFYVSHSGGKDSQAMYGALASIVPTDQIVVVHADLGKIEWSGVQDHIVATIEHELNVVRAGKTFFDMVRHMARTRPDVPAWPSSATRQCTSDLKRGPIHKLIRNDMKARGATLGVNCTGISEPICATVRASAPIFTKPISIWNAKPAGRCSTVNRFVTV